MRHKQHPPSPPQPLPQPHHRHQHYLSFEGWGELVDRLALLILSFSLFFIHFSLFVQ